MTVPLNETALQAARDARWTMLDGVGPNTRELIATYFASLAEQGLALVERKRCSLCVEEQEFDHCRACGGTGYIVLVDVREVAEAVRQARPLPDGADWPSRKAWADWIEARFAPEEPCARDSDWCDGRICRKWGIDCPKADPPGASS